MKLIFLFGLVCGGLLYFALYLNYAAWMPFLIPKIFINSIVFFTCGYLSLKRIFQPEDFHKSLFYRNGVLISIAIFFIGITFFSFIRTTLNYFYGQGYDDWMLSFFFEMDNNYALPLMISFFIPLIFIFKKPELETKNREDILDDLI